MGFCTREDLWRQCRVAPFPVAVGEGSSFYLNGGGDRKSVV